MAERSDTKSVQSIFWIYKFSGYLQLEQNYNTSILELIGLRYN